MPGGQAEYHSAEDVTRLKPLRRTSHALEAMVDRGIDRDEILRTIAAPERWEVDPPRRAVLMRRYFDGRLEREMLLRVVVEEAPTERVVVTIYKTSQIAKDLKRTGP